MNYYKNAMSPIEVHEEIELVRFRVDKSRSKEYFDDINKVTSFARELNLNMSHHYDEDTEIVYFWVGGYRPSKEVA